MTRSTHAVLLSLLAVGCTPFPYTPQDIVNSPRILDIVADPPEVAPGGESTLSVLYVDDVPGRAVTYQWTACVTAESIGAGGFSGAQFGTMQQDPGCPPPTPGTMNDLGTDAGATLPATLTGLFRAPNAATLSLLFRSTVTDESAMQLAALIHAIGVPILVQVTVSDAATGEELITAFKRVLIRDGASPNTNPPPPRFQIGDSWVSARIPGLPPFTCLPEDPRHPPLVVRGEEVTLTPDPDEAWVQSYTVFRPDGSGLQTVSEGGYYAWLSTGGGFKDSGMEQSPAREGVWTPPSLAEIGSIEVPLWIVVRDGHGGSSACKTMVALE